MEGNLAWSPDGKQIAFLKGYKVDFKSTEEMETGGETAVVTSTMGVTVGDLWVANADGTNQRQLTKCDTKRPFEEAAWVLGVCWSPAGNSLAYVHGTLFAGGQIVCCDPQTDRSMPLPYGVVFNATVSWTPDGQRLAFVGANWEAMREAMDSEDERDVPTALAVTGADGQGYRKLHETGELGRDQGWSPDGSKLLFELWPTQEGPAELWVVGKDGSSARPLVKGFGSEAVWSPKGTVVAYAGGDDAPGLWLMTVATGKRRQLVKKEVRSIRWPREGAGLFYGAASDDGGRAWLVRATDEKHLQLTTAGDVCGLYPSPDGKQVAVVVTVAQGAGQDVRSRNELYLLTLKAEAVGR